MSKKNIISICVSICHSVWRRGIIVSKWCLGVATSNAGLSEKLGQRPEEHQVDTSKNDIIESNEAGELNESRTQHKGTSENQANSAAGWPVAIRVPVVAKDHLSQQGCSDEEEVIFRDVRKHSILKNQQPIKAQDHVGSDEMQSIDKNQLANSEINEIDACKSTKDLHAIKEKEVDAPSRITDSSTILNSVESTNVLDLHEPVTTTKSPRDIGGRRSKHSKQPIKRREDVTAPSTSKPELICRKRSGSWQWDIVLVVPKESRSVEVHQKETCLSILGGECQLSDYRGDLGLKFEDGTTDKISLFDDQPLIFKSRNDWKGISRRISGITQGYFVVVAPCDWRRIDKARVESEACSDKNFSVHFFIMSLDEKEREVSGFEEYPVLPKQAALSLFGKRLFDNSDHGELFIGDVPTLGPLSSKVVWARVGSEASENDWKGQNFKPAERSLADILNGRQGRLFIRVFDAESKLLDSIGFRYLRDLREIHLNGKPYSAETILMPPPLGHPPAALQFIGADGTTIQPVITGDKNHATVQEGGNVIVAPHPEADKISFKLLSGTSHIDTVIELPRIWWQIKRDDDQSDDWHDTSWSMQRLEFRRYANERIRIRLRLPSQITSIHVGFDKQLERVYPSFKSDHDPSKRETVLCLAEFSDYSHIDQRLNTDAWLNVQCGEAIIALIRVFADPVPRINSFSSEPATVSLGEKALLQWATQNSESCLASIEPDIGSVALSGNISVTLTKTTTFMLRLTASGMDDVTTNTTVTVRYQLGKRFFARVKRKDGSFRRGKGFSRGEIRTAGLTHSDAARRSLPIDKRRRSTHQANVDTIRGVDNDASRKRGPTVERHNTTAL